MPVPRRFDRQPPERDTTRINERIRVPEVRLIDENGQQVGIMKTNEAIRYAESRELDLVEVAPDAKPPVCRVLDYSKYKYEQTQKLKAARKHQQQINIREIKFRPKIAQHDYDTKKGHVERFLNARDKVKVTIMFRGREMAHPERGEMILNRLAEDLGDLAIIEQRPQQDGRNMTMMLARSGRRRSRSPRSRLRAPAALSSATAHAQDEVPLRREEALQEDRRPASSRLVTRSRATSSRRSRRSTSARWAWTCGRQGRPQAVEQAARRQRAMTRVKRSVHARKKRRATLERAKGYRGEAHSSYRRAKEAVMKADSYAYRDRRNRKRDFRRLWITRINAAARLNGMSYGTFMHGLKLAGIEIDRKVLADIAVRDADTFRRFAEAAREALPA